MAEVEKDRMYYCGDGINTGALGSNPSIFLRFNPYLKKTENDTLPDVVIANIKKLLKSSELSKGA